MDFGLRLPTDFLLEIAATLIAWHREGNHKIAPLLIATLAKLGFAPKGRAALNVKDSDEQ
jgi:hypothetical protein